eukprot:m.296045 g.296045  ORF g.296045 m.296045 type:complete len:354 (-) comp13311_c0_seq1:103-1164(-)
MAATSSYDDSHQRIGQSLNNMRAMAPLMRKIEQAAIVWQRQYQASIDAAAKFYEAVEELVVSNSDRTPGVRELHESLTTFLEVTRHVDMMQKDVSRCIGEDIILPLSSRIASDQRTTQRLEKEYDKYSRQYVDEVKKAEKELEKWAKKARKMAANGYATANLSAAKQNVADRMHDLEQMRNHTLNQCILEEQRRYATLLAGINEYMKTTMYTCTQSIDQYKRGIDTIYSSASIAMRQRNERAPRPMSQAPMPRPSLVAAAMNQHGGAPAQEFRGMGVNQYRAKFDFDAAESGQLTLKMGDIITIEGDVDNNWQYGTNMRTQESGWFPANYIGRPQMDSVSAWSDSPRLPTVDY